MKHPLRLEICRLLNSRSSLSTKEIKEELEKTHKGEKQIQAVNDHVLSLRAVGIIELVEEWTENEGNAEVLMQRWQLTNHGREKYQKYW